MVAQFKDVLLELYNLFFVHGQFKLFDNFDCYFLASVVLGSLVDGGEVAGSDFFQYLVLVVDTVLLELVQKSDPLLLYLFILEVVLLLGVDSISVFDHQAEAILAGFGLNY